MDPRPAAARPARWLVALGGVQADVFLSLLLGALLVRDTGLLPASNAGWVVFAALLAPGVVQRVVFALRWPGSDHPTTPRLVVKVAALATVLVVAAVATRLEVSPSIALGALATRLIGLATFRSADDPVHRRIAFALTGVVVGTVFALGLDTGAATSVLSGSAPSFGQAAEDVVALGAVVALFELLFRQARAQAEGAQATERALAAERARIARELHDVVAHQMTGVVLQAQGASTLLRTDPDRAERALRVIEDSARAGLDELRRLLGVLREDEAATGAALMDQSRGDAVRTFDVLPVVVQDFVRTAWGSATHADDDAGPAPASVDEALEQARASTEPGHARIQLSVGDGAESAPPGVQSSAMRIVQESLTNVARHVGRAVVDIRIVRVGDDLVVQVENGPSIQAPATQVTGSGMGVIGMRERAEALGGTLHAGPTPAGGWEVRATLPVVAAGGPAEAVAP